MFLCHTHTHRGSHRNTHTEESGVRAAILKLEALPFWICLCVFVWFLRFLCGYAKLSAGKICVTNAQRTLCRGEPPLRSSPAGESPFSIPDFRVWQLISVYICAQPLKFKGIPTTIYI